MKFILNTMLKGLVIALLVVTLGGFLYINVCAPEEINLKLISSSLVNQVGTSPLVKDKLDESINLVENDNEKIDETSTEEKNLSETETNQQESPKETEIELPKYEEASQNDSTSNQATLNSNQTNEVNDNSVNNNQNNNSSNDNSYVESPSKETSRYAPNLEVANTSPVINTYYGNITAYGPDCVGCGGMVAYGLDVRNGNIYYNDKTYGNVRIVAGDRNTLKFGTIVRIKGLNISSEPIIAIMLDTGGAIGFNKNIYFDLLYESESAASSFGLQQATFEILRSGF